jgi:periplasmic divalent cation tolerance protein
MKRGEDLGEGRKDAGSDKQKRRRSDTAGISPVEPAHDVLVGFVTAPPGDAQRIASTLVEDGLAACCNVVPHVTSVFRWQGARETESEALLVIKTTRERAADLMDCVRRIHPYDLPEIILVAVASGLEDYLKWVRSECGQQGEGG